MLLHFCEMLFYTNIPHDLPLDCLDNLVKEAYRVRGATYISTGYSNIFWSDKISTGYTNMPVDKLHKLANSQHLY